MTVPDPGQRPAPELSPNGTPGGRYAGPFPLLDFEALQALPDADWLIDGIVLENSFNALFGASETAKSFLSLDWALSIAAGIPWFGHDVKGGHVVYLVGEGRGGMKHRALAWWETHGRPDLSRMHWLFDAVNLLNPDDVARTLATRDTLPEQPRLWVVDTVARMMPGGDENHARDMGLVVAAVDQMRDTAAGLVVHHTGRNGEHERGSTTLRAAADMMAKVERDGRSPRITLSPSKGKDVPDFEPVALQIEPAGRSCVLSLRIETEPAVSARDEVLELLREHGPIPSKNKIADKLGRRRDVVLEVVDELVAARVIHKPSKDGYQVVPESLGTTGNHPAVAAGADVVPARGDRDVVSPRREPLRAARPGSGSGTGTGDEPRLSDEDRAEALLNRHTDLAGGES